MSGFASRGGRGRPPQRTPQRYATGPADDASSSGSSEGAWGSRGRARKQRQERRAPRDDAALHAARRRGVGRERLTPWTPGGHRTVAYGGSLRRVADAGILPSREDEHRFTAVPGRYVPVGFARYASPVVDPRDYEYYRVAGWRVAVPRTLPSQRVRDLLMGIQYNGPQSVGFVRKGDTLVPATMSVGDRATIASSAVEYEPYPLSP